MGAGLAQQFKLRFPSNYFNYKEACERGTLTVGKLVYTDLGEHTKPRWIINFPTKKNWRDPSQLEYIETGLLELSKLIEELGCNSISIPALGCGLGGLDWEDVECKLRATFAKTNIGVFIFPPR